MGMLRLPRLRETRGASASTRRWISSATQLLPASMKSVRVGVSPDLELHAVVPVDRSAASTRQQPPVLCLPSSFGSVIHNYRLQFAALGGEFEFVGVDPRGYGYSRPPARDFPSKYFERDADDVVRAMDKLGYDKYSILGWSAGANAGAVLAAKYPDRVERLVLINGNAFVDVEDLDIFTKYGDVSNWHPAARAEGESIYGAEQLQQGWKSMMDKLVSVFETENGDLYCDKLPQIRCKTLVVAGGKDRMVPDFHSEYLNERIMHSKLHVFPNGRHDVHIQEPEAFNTLLRTFLTEEDDKHTQSREFVARPM